MPSPTVVRARRAAWSWLALCAFAAGAAAQAGGNANAAPAPQHLALLIGIDAYADAEAAGLNVLRGCERDVASARELLCARFGFADDEILALVGPAATHRAIVTAFCSHLIERADEHTQVVVWFAGHGSQVPDLSNADRAESEDGLTYDQTLLAYDSRADGRLGSLDFTDDELHSLLARLRAREVVVVADCCHSGGALRGDDRQARGVDAGTQPFDVRALGFWPEDVPFVDDDGGQQFDHVTFVAACGAEERAGEIRVEDGYHGTLTWALTNVLREAPAATTWREAIETVRARIAGLGDQPDQTVQGSGALGRAILGGTGRPLPAGFAVRRSSERRVQVLAGRIHGLGDGDELRLIDAEGREVARARVERANACVSFARVVEGRLPDAAIWAEPNAGLGGHSALHVACGDAEAARIVAGCAFAVPTPTGADADCRIARADGRLVLYGSDGTFVRPLRDSAEGLTDDLFREHCFRALWESVARPGRWPVGIAVAPPSDADVARYRGRYPAATLECVQAHSAVVRAAPLRTDADGRRAGGALLRITLRNDGDEPFHIALLSVTENREVRVLLGRDESNQLAPGAEHSIAVVVAPDPQWQLPRPMRDRYLAIATHRFADFRPYETPAAGPAARGADDDTAASKADGDASVRSVPRGDLPPILAAAFDTRTRGDGADGNRPWGITWFDVILPRAEAGAEAR